MAATKTSTSSESNAFIKQLASSNRTTRDRALSSLRTYLSHQTAPLTPLSNLKLWKGLFYSMFMSDKPRNQQALARDLAALPSVLTSLPAKLAFIAAFWQILAREWNNIDSLRLDKYLYLVRCYVAAGFQLLREEKWEGEVVGRYNEVLEGEGGPLSPRDSKVPGGVRLHVLDVWVDELEKVDGEEREAPLEEVMAAVRRLGKASLTKSVRERAREALEDRRLVDGKAWRDAEDPVEEVAEDSNDDDFGGFDD